MQNTSPLYPLQIIEKKGYGSNVSHSPNEIKKKLIDKIRQDDDLMKVLNEILSIRTAIKNSDVSKRGNPSFSINKNRIVTEFAKHVLSSSSFSIDTSNLSELIKFFFEKEGFIIRENQQESNQNLTSYFPPISKLVLGLAMISASLPTVISLPSITPGCSKEGASGPNRNCPTAAQAKQTTLAILFTSTAPVVSTSIFPQTTAHNLVPSTTTEAIKIATSTSVENGIETTSITATNPELGITTTLKIIPSTYSSAEAKEDTTTTSAKITTTTSTTSAEITTPTTTPTTTTTTIQTTSTTLPGTTSTPDATTSTPQGTTSSTPPGTTSQATTTNTTSSGEKTTSDTSAQSSTITTAEATTTQSSSTTNATSPAGTSTSTTQALTTSTPAETTTETTTTVKPTTAELTTAELTTAEPTTAEPTTSTTSAEPTTSTTTGEPTTSKTKMTTTTAGLTESKTTTAGLTESKTTTADLSTSTTVTPADTSQFPSTSLTLEGTTRDNTTGVTTTISGYTTSTTLGTTSITVETSPYTSLNAEITTSPDGSYKITSPLTSAEIGCSPFMASLSSDSSHEDVVKAMMQSLATIEHLRKINPDIITSSIAEKIINGEQKLLISQNEYRLALNESLHCISQTNSSGVETNKTFANISNPCGAGRRQMICETTTPKANQTPGPNPATNSQQNSNHLALPLGLGLGLGIGIPALLAAGLYARHRAIRQNTALLEKIEPQTAPAASARAAADVVQMTGSNLEHGA